MPKTNMNVDLNCNIYLFFLPPPFGPKSTIWKRLGNAFKDPVSGVRMTSNTVFLWPGSKTNVPSVLTKSFPEIAGDMTVRPIVSVLLNS